MDEGLFLMMLFCGFLLFASIIYCFLSTCIGLEIRRSDIIEAFTPSALLSQSGRAGRRGGAGLGGPRTSRAEYEMELDNLDNTHGGVGAGNAYDRLGGASMGGEELEMLRRSGPGKYY